MSDTSNTTWRAAAVGEWRPTVAFVRAALVAILLVTIAVLSRRPDLLVIGTPFAVVTAWSASTRPRTAPTLVDRLGNTTVREGDATTWRGRLERSEGVDLVSARTEPALWLEAAHHGAVAVPAIGGRCELAVVVRSTRWGRRLVPPVRLVASSPWGAFQSSMHTAHVSLTTLPVPARFDAAAPRRPSDGLVGLERSSRRGEGSEFAGVRPFGVGDRIRRINWTRSLRSDRLQVNATWADQDTHVALVIDAGDDYGLSEGVDGAASSLDTAVRAAGAIAEHAGRHGDRISLRVFGTIGRLVVPTAAGPMQLRRVLDTLSRVQPGRGSTGTYRGTLPPWPATGAELTVVLSPLISNEALDRAVSLGRHGLPVVVIDTLPESVAVDDDPYASLAWRIRLLERRREIRRVQRAGIPVVRWLGPGSLDEFLRDVARRASAPRMRVG